MNGEKIVVVAEKASVARAIKVVVAAAKMPAVVTAVRGHLMEADLPEGYEWGNRHPLEIIGLRNVVYKVSDTRSFENLVNLFNDGGVLVVATDNDSEGELIGYEILQTFERTHGGKAECYRMRFNSLDRRELFASLRNLEKGLNMRWVEKAQFRQIFDLITGAAFTRLLTLSTRKKTPVRLISWGSCQTPTLNFVVEREKQIQQFKPQKYWVIEAILRTTRGETFKVSSEPFWNQNEFEKVFTGVQNISEAFVKSYQSEEKGIPRPLPMRTDDVLRDLTRLTGLSASKLLNYMEELYAEGYISYPRTDTNRYRKNFDFETPLKAVTATEQLKNLRPNFETPTPRNGPRDDGAHPPIYPLKPYTGGGILNKIWEYIARRFYANAFFADAVQRVQHVSVALREVELKARGAKVVSTGFFEAFGYFKPEDKPLPELSTGERLEVLNIEKTEAETKPPSRLTEAELLRLMEKNGIGTDATRALYPQLIIDRNYALKAGKVFKPTALGMALIESLSQADLRLVTPETRRFVEESMAKIERGESTLKESLEQSLTLYTELLKICNDRIEEISSRLAQSINMLQRKPLKNYARKKSKGRLASSS